ncbi:rna binding protein [Stylonychia lemnae]|uniref:Rna binding protein n=1 Tax=Stylonychia lemnae TaxID=5949 RepID=A0A078BCF8_STYLE|nr:rna binding protein [Stylonychia lemnae]|eukprot:CDW90887.1 rna binding protein [Stylonychia lemnae]
MSLFVGNISKNVRKTDLVDEFEKFGKCDINHKGTYAFIEFDSERDAEDAVTELQGKDMGGLKINIEWSKKSGRFSAKDSKRPARQERSRDDLKCFNCNKTGHFARDCRQRRRSRSRSGDRRRGGRRDDHDRNDRNGGRRRSSRSRSSSRGKYRGSRRSGGDRDRERDRGSRRHGSRSKSADSRPPKRASSSRSDDRRRTRRNQSNSPRNEKNYSPKASASRHKSVERDNGPDDS